MEKIVIVGCGGHAKTIVDMIEAHGQYEIAGFVDTLPDAAYDYRGYKIIATDANAGKLYDAGIRNAVIGVGMMGNSVVREKIYAAYKKIGFSFPTIIDPSAVLAADVEIGEGTVVGKLAVINSAATIGCMAIINTAAIIEHDCMIGNHSHVSVGAVLCGNAKVGRGTFVGANSTVIQGIEIGNHVVIGAGSTVINNVMDNEKKMGLVK